MDPLSVLELLEKTSGKNDKIQILKQHKSPQLIELLHAALAFSKKYHIKKFNVTPKATKPIANAHAKLIYILNKLEKREIVGNQAIAEVETFLSSCNPLQAKWYSRVIKKDLQAGFSESTANKAGYKIPVFNVMLAKDGKKCKNADKIIKAGGWISKKFDGYRCLAIKDGQDVTLYSRNGKQYHNFPSIANSIRKLPQAQLVLDGEIMSSSFNAMQEMAFSHQDNSVVNDVKYHIFDRISYKEWMSGDFKQIATDRFEAKAALNSDFVQNNISNLVIVVHTYVDNMQTLLNMERNFIEQGYEGIMFLPKDCPYFRGRKSNKLMKFKTMLSMDCKVTEIYEGINKYENMLGGINVIQENGIVCSCGSGFNDEQRSDFWNHPEQIINRIVEIKYQELTNDGVMRFPIFVRFRNDKM